MCSFVFLLQCWRSAKITLIFNCLLEFKHIAVKLRENKDEENSGGVEQQPFLCSNADTNTEGIYWSNAQRRSGFLFMLVYIYVHSFTLETRIYIRTNNFDTASSASELGGDTEQTEQEGI